MPFDFNKYHDEYWMDKIQYEDKYGKYISKLKKLLLSKFNLDAQVYIIENHNYIPLYMSIDVSVTSQEQDVTFIEELFNSYKKLKSKQQKRLSAYIDLDKYSLEDIYTALHLL